METDGKTLVMMLRADLSVMIAAAFQSANLIRYREDAARRRRRRASLTAQAILACMLVGFFSLETLPSSLLLLLASDSNGISKDEWKADFIVMRSHSLSAFLQRLIRACF